MLKQKMSKKKKSNSLFGITAFESRAKFKKTSIGRNPSKTMMNKSNRKNHKKYKGQGK